MRLFHPLPEGLRKRDLFVAVGISVMLPLPQSALKTAHSFFTYATIRLASSKPTAR